jgi:hypothetical protein
MALVAPLVILLAHAGLIGDLAVNLVALAAGSRQPSGR